MKDELLELVVERYRMYVDEVGNGALRAFDHESNRRLTMVGLVIDESIARTVMHPRLEVLKAQCFDCHPDDKIVSLHRKEIVVHQGVYCVLKDERVRSLFETGIESIFSDVDYKLVVVSLDKVSHVARYGNLAYEPYAFCLEMLLERFVHEMRDLGVSGDVVVESPGRKPAIKLDGAYQRWMRIGTGAGMVNLTPEEFSGAMSSKQLKFKLKSDNIAGLQLVDLIAQPMERHLLGVPQKGLSDRIARIAADKLRRGPAGDVLGFGWKSV